MQDNFKPNSSRLCQWCANAGIKCEDDCLHLYWGGVKDHYKPRCCKNCADWKTPLCKGKFFNALNVTEWYNETNTKILIKHTDPSEYCSWGWRPKKEE